MPIIYVEISLLFTGKSYPIFIPIFMKTLKYFGSKRASGIFLGRIGEVGDRTSEGRLLGHMGQVLQRGLWQGRSQGWDEGSGDQG